MDRARTERVIKHEGTANERLDEPTVRTSPARHGGATVAVAVVTVFFAPTTSEEGGGESVPPQAATADARSRTGRARQRERSRFEFFTGPFHVPDGDVTNVRDEMRRDETTEPHAPQQRHRHTAVVAHELRQQSGIPYEVERKVCSDCRTVLDERTVRRAAA